MSVGSGNFFLKCFPFQNGEVCGNKKPKTVVNKHGKRKNPLSDLCGKHAKRLKSNWNYSIAPPIMTCVKCFVITNQGVDINKIAIPKHVGVCEAQRENTKNK